MEWHMIRSRPDLGSWIPRNICNLDPFEDHSGSFNTLSSFFLSEIIFTVPHLDVSHLRLVCYRLTFCILRIYKIIFGHHIIENDWGILGSRYSASEEHPALLPGLLKTFQYVAFKAVYYFRIIFYAHFICSVFNFVEEPATFLGMLQ